MQKVSCDWHFFVLCWMLYQQERQFRPGRAGGRTIFNNRGDIFIQQMEAGLKSNGYHPQHYFSYPFTIISPPKKTFTSKAIQQPSAYEVYCPISCKKIKIGVFKGKQKEGLEFNTTSNRWVSALLNKNIRYLINGHPPNKKDKRQAEGSGWGYYVEVSEKGNFAIFNPYCTIINDPLSLYTFSPIHKYETVPELPPFHPCNEDKLYTSIHMGSNTLYLKQSENGSYISTNSHFNDSSAGQLTFSHPNEPTQCIIIKVEEALKVIPAFKQFWLHQLHIHIIAEKETESGMPTYNLDDIYSNLRTALHLEEQLRAKLSNEEGVDVLNNALGHHPRLYSAINRLASFINYGVTKYNTKALAEAGFYNKSDCLQDLAYFEHPQIPIPVVEDPSFHSELNLRQKLFPFSRIERKLPNVNIPLDTYLNAIMHQSICKSKIKHYQVCGPYILFVDEQGTVSVWSCRLFPIRLFYFWAGTEEVQITKTALLVDEKIVNLQHMEKEDNSLASLFQELAPPPKEEIKPAEMVPDQTMIEQMVNMGYGLTVVKKALLAVKNESVPAAIDMIEQILTEEKKKKKVEIIRKAWSCPVCTFFNKSENETCEMCGELNDVVDQAEKEKKRLEEEAEKQKAKKEEEERIETEKKIEAQKTRLAQEELEKQKKKEEKEEMLRKAELLCTKFIYRQRSPIDPFFVVQIFWLAEKDRCNMKITRVGLSREYFSNFYRIEDNNLTSFLNRFPYDINFESFETVAAESVDQREWGIRLIEPSKGKEWGVVEIKEIQLPSKFSKISINGDIITLSEQDKQVCFSLQPKDTITESTFNISPCENPGEPLLMKEQKEERTVVVKQLKDIQVQVGKEIPINCQVSEIEVEIIEHLPGGVWKKPEPLSSKAEINTSQEGEVVMNQLLPLAIEHFEGSVFSSKNYCSTMLEKSQQLYISNYPKTNFTFRHLGGKSIYAESIVIQSSNKRLQRIFSICQGLIFTADQPTWFHLAKERFDNCTKEHYENWLTTKRARTDHREFWEPVGYFHLDGETEIELDYKRTAKYIFLLPTNVKGEPKKDEVYAIKIDFFGVKGRVEEERSSEGSLYKNQGSSGCKVDLFQNGALLDEASITPRHWGHINSFHYYPPSQNFLSQAPLTTTTVFFFKLRSNVNPTSLRVESKYAKKVIVRLNKEAAPIEVDSSSIKSFQGLVKMQNQFSVPQLKKIAEELSPKELIVLLLKAQKEIGKIEALLSKLEDSVEFREKLHQGILEMVPQLINDSVEVTEKGFKNFMALYEREITGEPNLAFASNTEALKKITRYVNENRNKNYNLLRLKYNIEELVLQPSYFSKQYYRMVHPNFVEEEPKSLVTAEPTGPVNCSLFIHQRSPYFYRSYIDLHRAKKIDNIKLYVPKITNQVFRPKLLISVWVIDDKGQQLIYSKYFHEELMVQLGVYGYKDSEIYRGEKLNYWTINDVNFQARFLKVEYSFLLGTTQPYIKYKDTVDKFFLIPLVEGKETATEIKADNIIKILQTFPQETRHLHTLEKMPPCRHSIQGDRSMFAVHEFPVVEGEAVKQEYKDLVEKITSNIMDETIVREAIKGMKISNYQFNQKGIDFAYTYILHLMTLSRKFPPELHVSVELMLEIFDVLIVFEAGPIMRKAFAFLQDNYKRLSNPQKVAFSNALIQKYLMTIDTISSIRITERYSPLKILEKLQHFDLLLGNLFNMIEKSTQKSLKILLVKLISFTINSSGLGSLELYSPETGKYIKDLSLLNILLITFKNSLWVMDNVSALKEQALKEALDLLLMFISADGPATLLGVRGQAVKSFVENVEVEELWRLVFLTLKLKCEPLKEKINKLFTVITSNLTDKLKRSINGMLHQIIMKQEGSLYVAINSELTEQLWMNHLQTTLELVTLTKDSLYLDLDIALKLLELPLTPRLWSLALNIIPRIDEVLITIIKNFPKQYYNSLGKEITHFCEPLAGIRSLDSIHINWLDLVRQIRLEGKNIFSLFVGQLQKTSFGGRDGLTMASISDLRNLEVACEIGKLVVEGKLDQEHLKEESVRKLLLWYFLNKSKDKGCSPCTDKILFLSQTVKQLLTRMAEFEETAKVVLRLLLEIRREGELIERNFAEKRVPVHAALTLNRRFSDCFEELLTQFMTSDELSSLFAFQLGGLQYLLKTMDIESQEKEQQVIGFPPDQENLVSEKLIAAKESGEKVAIGDPKEPDEMKEEEFANNVKLMPDRNLPNMNPSNPDWTIYKKGNKNKIIFLTMTDPSTYHEHPLYIQLTRTAEIRSLKMGFTAASYQFNDKLVATPSAVIVEGSLDGVSFEPIGEMDYLQDDAYIMGGVQVWVLNCQRLKGCKSVGETVQSLNSHRAKYLKIIVKRPSVTFIEGQYSQLNGRNYNNLGCSLTFLSVTGDDVDKMPWWLVEGCKQISRKSALRVLGSLLSEINARTMRSIANDEQFSGLVQANFQRIRQYMGKYPQVMPQVVYMVGAGNPVLGDWIVQEFLKSAGAEVEARIVNQIIVSTPGRTFPRLALFLESLLEKMMISSKESEIQAGLLYANQIHFIEAFCKTLEQSYDLGLPPAGFSISLNQISSILDIYDIKHSSPDIKSAVKLLVNLLHIKAPLKLNEDLLIPVMDLVWKNCSEHKTHLYHLLAALLVDRRASNWLRSDNHSKVQQLLTETYAACEAGDVKNLKLQLPLLSQISHHESKYLRDRDVHVELYNRVKTFIHQESDITEAVLKLMKKVVLGSEKEEHRIAKLLFDDVGLLVKRRDPFFQRLFVGLLGLEEEVMISLGGLEVQATPKKEPSLGSKWLSKKQVKQVMEKTGKKFKCSLLGEVNTQIKADHQELFLKAFGCPAFLLVLKCKVGALTLSCGIYSPATGRRNQEGDYFWEEMVHYHNAGFLFFLTDQEPLFIINEGSEAMLGNIYGGDQDHENAAMFYDEGLEVFQFNFDTSEATVPKINLTKYKKQLPNELTLDSLDNHPEFQFLGMELWELKPTNTLALSESKITNLLSKSNHVRPPFSYCRHAPIYTFPANLTVTKFMTILGVKGTCETHGKKLPETTSLSQLEQESSDFVVDLDIQTQAEINDKEVNQIGYIPVMRIFNHFSSLNGVGEVLRLGSESIKEWKKADRKKNFQHYMDQLRSFISLPSFFNLFIKNQQYVTLLFQVASGLPDDESSTRNWQEQYVNNFRYIYKIVSDIFKFDRSPVLRDMDKYSDFLEVILEKLTQISKEKPRTVKEEEDTEEKEVVPDGISKLKSEDRKKKKKGTGYGADSQNNSKWSASEWLQTRKNHSQQILRVISIIASFLDCETPLRDSSLGDTIKESCLLPILESSLRSGSLLDISKEAELFKAYLQIVKLLSSHPSTIDCVLELEKKYKPEQSESIYSLLGKLNGNATIFSECLKSGKEQKGNQTAEVISTDIQKTYIIVDKAVQNLKKRGKGFSLKELDSMSVPEAYRILLGGQRFGYSNFKEGTTYRHAHSGSISNTNPPTSKILRLSQELADLSTSLPCESTNAIFLRCDHSRIDVMQILVMGSKDTPYSNGAYTFDIYCDDSYPNNPPKMLITTTGQGKIRFNPNLYSCGKVCLSLLGTWRGSASENWDPKVSTLLQLFISTQGITMSEDVYFNEPGFEGQQGTEEGDRKNQAYSNIVKLGNIRYAMIGQLKNPAKGFQEAIRRHFYIKRKEILEQCDKWMQHAEKREASYNGLVNDHNSTWCTELKQSKTKYKELLAKEIEELKQLLDKLPPPDLHEKQEQQSGFTAHKQKKQTELKAVDIKLEEVDVEYEKESKIVKEYGENVMQDRWSRYIGAMGIEAVKKQAESSVLLVGLKPLGLEIAKNLVLSGLKRLTILEDSSSINNSEHFYMANLKSDKLKDCIFKIKELNPYMVIDHTETVPADLEKYAIVVSTADYDFSSQLAEQARKVGAKFIYAETKGVSGIYFADLGEAHEVNDNNGEEPFEGIIKSISNEEEGLVTLLDGVKHPYEDGDCVVLNLVEGMQTLQQVMEEKSEVQLFFEKQSQQKCNGINNRVFKIKVVNWNSFRIGDTRNFGPYKANGLCRNLKVPKKHQFISFSEASKKFEEHLDPNMGIYDFEKMAQNLPIFLSFQALGQYRKANKALPPNWSVKESKVLVDLVDQSIKTLNKSQEQVEKALKFASQFSYVCEAELPVIGAYLGGLVAQEVIKAITNKYMPIKQFFTFHFNEMVQKVPEESEALEKLIIKSEEDFRSLKIVLGNQGAKKVEELKTFVIGAGAIGCELLKNFAMANMGANGEIVVTDPDHIETSNLSRQFLFRDKHVKKAKSATACATLLQLNPRLEGHIHARLDKVCEETEEIYSDSFFKSRGVVANALDNVRARVYMDKRCVENKIPLFESGTLGPKGHVQVIVPFKTENYGSQNDPSEQNQIPHCTLKMFPEETVHCIEWARDIFGKMFTLNPKALKKVIQAKDLGVLEGAERETAAKMIKYRPESFDDCIDEAVRKFYVYYRNNVKQLLFTYPIDMKTKEGKSFWALPKRPPKQISELDPNDQVHRCFISAYAVLLAKIYSLPFPKDFRKKEEKDNIMKTAIKVKVEDFIPNAEASKEIQKEVEKQNVGTEEKMGQGNLAKVEKEVSEEVKLTQEVLEIKPLTEQFEKDEDSNGHIDLIYSMSSLRCRNYGLNECTWIEAKLKAGKILAALSTTTSVIAALQTIEIIKLATGGTTWRNGFINIAVPLIQITEPGPPVKYPLGNTSFTVWDEWNLKASTLKQVFAQIKETYQAEAFNVSTKGGQPVYWQAMYADKEEARQELLNTKLSTMFQGSEVELSIAMRKIGGESYEQVPKIKITIEP